MYITLQVELEERREGEIEDYWLIQFQRLMDQKPETLIIKVKLHKQLSNSCRTSGKGHV